MISKWIHSTQLFIYSTCSVVIVSILMPRAASFDSKDMERMFVLFPRLKERLHQYGGLLSGGEQQMLAISRGLMSKPDLLMLDEPSLGLAPIIVGQIFDILEEISSFGTAILLVEQNAYKALRICRRAYILSVGTIVKSGTSAELLQDKDLVHSYLG